MKELFLNYLQAGLAGSIIIIVVFLLRLLLRKAPRKIICLLWLIAAVRLLLPFQIESSFSLQPPQLSSVTAENFSINDLKWFPEGFTDSETAQALPDSKESMIPSASLTDNNLQNAATPAPKQATDYLIIVSVVWICVTGAFLLYAVISYILLKFFVRDAIRTENGVWESEKIGSAFLLGYFRPRIYLPFHLNPQDRDFMIAHEQAHISRGDHWWKLTGFLTLSLHWYNPFVWLGFILLCRDIELACDEKVISGLDLDNRKAYSTALLNGGKHIIGLSVSPVAFGEVSLNQRIHSVLSYKKPTLWITGVAVVCAAIIGICFLTTPKEKPQKSEDPASEPSISSPDNTTEPSDHTSPVPQEDDLSVLKRQLSQKWNYQISYRYMHLAYNGFSQETIQTYAKDGSFFSSTERSYWDHPQDYEESTSAEFYYRYEDNDLICYFKENDNDSQRSAINAKAQREMEASRLMLVGPDGLLPKYLEDFTERSENTCYTFRLPVAEILKDETLLSIFIQNAFILYGSQYDESANISIMCTLETESDSLRPIKLEFDFSELKPYVLSSGALSGEYAFDTDLMYMRYIFNADFADTISIPDNFLGNSSYEPSPEPVEDPTEGTTEPTETTPSSETSPMCRLVVDGRDITSSCYVNFKEAEAPLEGYGGSFELPVLAIMRALGSQITYGEDPSIINIAYNGNTYELNTEECVLTPQGSRADLLILAPGGRSSIRYMRGGDLIVSNELLSYFLGRLGYRIMIDQESNCWIAYIQ